MKKYIDLWFILVIQIITIPIVIGVFHFVQPRNLAASIAGTWFCSSGLFMVWKSYVWKENRWKSPTLWASALFTFGVAFPMFVMRSLNFNIPLAEIHIWGIDGESFHKLSNKIYMVMMAATVFELIRERRLIKSQKSNASNS